MRTPPQGRWRHAVPIVDGTILEQHEQRIDIAQLYLQETTGAERRERRCKPDARRAYLRHICKVYKVYACEGEEDGCTGDCRPDA